MSAIQAIETVGRPLRIVPVVGAVLLCVFSVELLFVPLEASARKRHPHYDANHVRWRDSESCAFSAWSIGDNAVPAGGGTIIDLRELDDPQHHNRVVGVVFVSSNGRRFYQVNPLFPLWDRMRLMKTHMFSSQGFWSGSFDYDPHVVNYPERECQPNHLSSGMSNSLVRDEAQRRIYDLGEDSIPTGRLSATSLHTPFLDKEKDDDK